jgi:hypothetical protein
MIEENFFDRCSFQIEYLWREEGGKRNLELQPDGSDFEREKVGKWC